MKKYFLPFLLSALGIACTQYGPKVGSGNIEVYYKEGISKTQAEKTATLFRDALMSSNPNDKATKSFQLSKPGDSVLLKMVADKARLGSVEDDAFYAMSALVSDSVFAGAPVNLALTDNKFKEFRYYAFKKPTMEDPSWGTKYESGNVELFANGVDSSLAGKLAGYLETYFNPANTFSFQVSTNEQGVFVVKMVIDPSRINDITEADMAEASNGMSEKVFSGSPLQFQLADASFKPLRVFIYPSDTAPAENMR
ncbi:MAG: hypothetical protein HYZ15_04310 [Sphingobacteriales bacterium]|nr:hypothetical protein [Sphingobacteriales bacterium]